MLKTHIKGTQRKGEHGGESRQSHGGAEGTKSDRDVVYVLLIALVINMGLQDLGVTLEIRRVPTTPVEDINKLFE